MPLITTLGLFADSSPLPATHAVDDRKWRLSSVVPMGGRIIFERVSCSTAASEPGVRLLVNDAVMTIPGCEKFARKEGNICPLAKFIEIVNGIGERVGDFEKICQIDKSVAGKRPSFLNHHSQNESGRVFL